jgi:hypothetical protein
METFIKLFGSLLLFVYHCFDRVVINGYGVELGSPGERFNFVRSRSASFLQDESQLSDSRLAQITLADRGHS